MFADRTDTTRSAIPSPVGPAAAVASTVLHRREPHLGERLGVDGRRHPPAHAVGPRDEAEQLAVALRREGDVLDGDATPAERNRGRDRVPVEVDEVGREPFVCRGQLGEPALVAMDLGLAGEQLADRPGVRASEVAAAELGAHRHGTRDEGDVGGVEHDPVRRARRPAR